jgi:ribosome-associated heat shock protein Hsp15
VSNVVRQAAGESVNSSFLRIDKWLWFTRFYKSRSQSTDAVAGGRVHVNGERVKPAYDVKIGDQLRISRDTIRFELTVIKIPARRGPAAEAQACYEESMASIAERAKRSDERRFAPQAPDTRPDKHARRELRQLRGR